MNKYVYSICGSDTFPEINSLQAISYNDAIEHLINKLAIEFDDDKIASFDEIFDLQCYMNDNYNYVISDLWDIDVL